MGKMQEFKDKLSNLVANLGTSRDKSSHSNYLAPVVNDHELVNAYRGAWLPRKIVDIPALDACRNWRNWQADSEQIAKIEDLERALGVRKKILEAMKKARLFGGAAVYIGTGDGNSENPITDNAKIQHLTVFTRRQLTADQLDDDPDSDRFGKPLTYTLANTHQKIHHSRLVEFIGAEFPDDELAVVAGYQGWGDSVLTAVMGAIKDADNTTANIASLIFEAKIDVFKIPNFMAGMNDPEYESQVLSRLTLAMKAKGINGALLVDSEEDYEQKSANFSGLKDLLYGFLQVVSGASDIPVTRLLGQSPGGLQNTGDNDMRNYYDRVSSIQELDMEPAMAVLDRLIVRNAIGSNSKDVTYAWAPLWQNTEKEQADIGKTTADTIKTLSDTRLIPDDVLSKAAITALSERDVMPGIDNLMEEFGGELPEDDSESLAAMDARFTDGIPKTLYVSRAVENADQIRAWAESQGIGDLVDDMHVTIAFSREKLNWMEAGQSWGGNENGTMRMPPGGPREVEVMGDGKSVALLFQSHELQWRHEEIKNAGASWDWPEYQPHITLTTADDVDLSSVEPYQGPIVLGPERFETVNDD